jgi:hypothetical protein
MTPAQQHRNWRSDVAVVVRDLERRFPNLECITYVDHPWPGWDGRSFDVWRRASTWTPATLKELRVAKRWCMNRPGGPFIRHTILRHRLWTSFGGASYWAPNDHSGRTRHLHVTYW